MDNLSSKLKVVGKWLGYSARNLAITHKKKLIFLVVALALGYIIKKKMTLAHFISMVESVSKFIQYLPLPQSAKLRDLAPYQHPTSSPLKLIIEAIKLDEIRDKISKKQSTWEQLKISILTGTVVTLAIYNANSFYFLVQNKYRQDFSHLEASAQFDEAMYVIRKKFTQSLSQYFEYFKKLLYAQFSKIQLMKNYCASELNDIFEELTERIFKDSLDLSSQLTKSKIDLADCDSKNRFTTPYEYVAPTKSSKVITLLSKILSVFGGMIRVGEWFPQPRVELSSQRYEFIKDTYILSLKKADVQSINWPNKQSKDLFSLVIEQLNYVFLSINFSVLLKEYTAYNLTILQNRILLLFNLKKKEYFKFSEFLPGLYKILQEQFLKSCQIQQRDKFHDNQVRRGIKIVNQPQQEVSQQMISLEELILNEVQMKNKFNFLQKQFELKFYNQRSGVVIHPQKAEVQNKQADQIQKMLGFLGGSSLAQRQ